MELIELGTAGPFSPFLQKTLKLYEKVEDDDCQFVLKDMRTREAKEVK
jgi:hypothetical protein